MDRRLAGVSPRLSCRGGNNNNKPASATLEKVPSSAQRDRVCPAKDTERDTIGCHVFLLSRGTRSCPGRIPLPEKEGTAMKPNDGAERARVKDDACAPEGDDGGQ